LTANANFPRAATASRAASAMNSAARLATASASGSTSTFMMRVSDGDDRVVPSTIRRHHLHLRWPPRVRWVFVNRRAGAQHRVDDAPRFLDVVLAREQCRIAVHGIAQTTLVGVHLAGGRTPAGDHLTV